MYSISSICNGSSTDNLEIEVALLRFSTSIPFFLTYLFLLPWG